MNATSRELVWQTLRFENPGRAPRQIWTLPWASLYHAADLAAIRSDYPDDIAGANGHWSEWAVTQGDPYQIGRFKDEWGSVFTNIQQGVIGEVKDPLISDWDADAARVHIPLEWLTIDVDAVNRDCAVSDRFLIAGCCPRPFEQLQFLRGSVGLYQDLMDQPAGFRRFLEHMHAFYCDLLQAWARTDVDAFQFMDDWGSQRVLLIHPELWRDVFRPLYRDYIEIAHSAGKAAFMHSDGHILAIYPDLVELGLDAVNSQIFCMGIENLRPFAGKITFWGEVDRQDLLPHATVNEIDQEVGRVHAALWKRGGCIAQCEFGAGARPENVRQVYASWDRLTLAGGG